MKVLIAIDSFKGSISSSDACLAAARGFARAGITDITSLPSSDGGEGFCVCMRSLFGGEVLHDTVAAPCGGQTDAGYVFDFASETAYVELACASGLTLVPEGKRDIMSASTLGTGELIKAAAAAGAKRIVIGLGGSATNDCGMGLLHALGVRFYGADGNVLVPCARSMPLVARADKTALRGYEGISFTAACDVTNPLCGENGAARVFARQKGASEREISLLDEYAASFAHAVGIDPLSAGAGAAGGTGGALISVLGAEFVSGASLLTGAERFRKALSGASLVLTGEGNTDGQTASGKLVCAVADAAKGAGVPCVAISGGLSSGCELLYSHGVTAMFSLCSRPASLEYCMENAGLLMESAAYNVARLVSASAGEKQ